MSASLARDKARSRLALDASDPAAAVAMRLLEASAASYSRAAEVRSPARYHRSPSLFCVTVRACWTCKGDAARLLLPYENASPTLT